MVIVTRIDDGRIEREDRYDSANTCTVDATGALKVLRGGTSVVAAYAAGHWRRATSEETK